MNTQEHLTAIRAKCVELLARKDDGFVMPAGYVGKYAIKGEHYRSGYSAGRAALAGPAEAGWAATIAAIDGLLRITAQGPIMGSVGPYREGQLHALEAETEHAKEAIAAIIAAWPEELLK